MPDNALPLELDDKIKDAIGTAFDSGNYITVAYNGDDGWPHVSHRGTTQVFGPQQLAIWVRKRDDGLAQAIGSRPKLTLFQLQPQLGQIYTFYGRGHLSTDDDVMNRVWDNMPERERASDPDRKGIVLIVELERIAARGKERNFIMERPTT